MHLHRTLSHSRSQQGRRHGVEPGDAAHPDRGNPRSLRHHPRDVRQSRLGPAVPAVILPKSAPAFCATSAGRPVIEVDGGLSGANAWQVIEAGASAIVAGSAVLAPGYAAAIAAIRQSAPPLGARPRGMSLDRDNLKRAAERASAFGRGWCSVSAPARQRPCRRGTRRASRRAPSSPSRPPATPPIWRAGSASAHKFRRARRIDLAIDGADRAVLDLDLIKGHGALFARRS